MLKRHLILPLMILMCVGYVTSLAQAESAAQSKSNTAKVLQLLEDSKYNYRKAADEVWAIPYTGDNLKEFNVVVVLEQNLVVLVVIMAEKDEFKLSNEMMMKMLNMNDQFDRVKIGISDKGDAFLRIDLSLRILDTQELKENIEQIAAAADEAYVGIKPFLIPAKPGGK